MSLDADIARTLQEATAMNSGSFHYQSGSVNVSSSCAIGYGYIQQWDMLETGYNQDITNISVFIPRTNNTAVLRPNQTCSLVGNHISASFSIAQINNYNPIYIWCTLRGRKDSVFVPT